MKKKLLFFIFCLMIVQLSSYAQLKFGVKAGVPFNIQNLEIKNAKIETSRPFNLGLTSECIFPILNIGFEVSALYELERITGSDLQKSVSVGYLIIPVNFKYKLGIKPFKVFAFAGPSLEIMLHNSGDIVLPNYSLTKSTSTIKYSPENFNWGLNAGLGFEVWKIQASIAYFYNFQTPLKEIPDDILHQTASDDAVKSNQNGFVVSLAWFF
ncbi:MAG: putative secreted protein [Bacteroidetes bacterium]|nr:putative secreted protein [Bacteroidota bacterium]